MPDCISYKGFYTAVLAGGSIFAGFSAVFSNLSYSVKQNIIDTRLLLSENLREVMRNGSAFETVINAAYPVVAL
jgi:hypothetical protein